MMSLLVLYCFAVPWEYALDLGEPLGNIARILGVAALLAVIPMLALARMMRAPGTVQWLVLALYVYFVCSYFWTANPEATLEKIRAYFQVMLVVWIAWEAVTTPLELRWMMRAFVAGCWVLAALTIANFAAMGADAGGAMVAQQIRFAAEGQDPNDVARLLDLGFPLAALLFAVEDGWLMRTISIGYVPLGLLAVVLTASRGGFLAALLALLGSSVLLVSWRPRIASIVFAGLAVTAGALLLLAPAGSMERLATIPQEVGGGSLNDRAGIWAAGWQAFAKAPWFGYGAGTYSVAARLSPGDTAHNTVLAVLVMGGLAGLGIFLSIVAETARAVARTSALLRIALGSTLAVFALTSMVGSVEEQRTTWLLIAMMAVAGRLAIEEPRWLGWTFAGWESEQSAAELVAVR
jgi:O-antigen ligase